jgi:hypothetical protein
LRRGYRRPVRRDRALWVALGLTVVAVVIEFALAGPSTPLGWLAFGLIAAALAVLIVSLVGVAVGVFRGFGDGWRANRSKPSSASSTSSDRPAPSQPAATSADGDRPATDAGSSGDGPSLPRPAVPESVKNLAAAAQAKAPTKQTVDRTARALGRAAGAARRAYRNDD